MTHIKRILSILLAALLILCACQIAFAEDFGAKGYEGAERTDYPTILLAGGFHELYTDYGTPEQKAYFDTSDSMVTDKETMDMVIAAATALDFDALGIALGRMFTKAYADVAMDCDGESINPNIECSITFYLPAGSLEALAAIEDEYVEFLDDESKAIRAAIKFREADGRPYLEMAPGAGETLYFMSNWGYFSFDWRLDPVYNAGLLNKWIKEEFIDKGVSDKVNLAFVSGSGPIGLAYLGEYGTEYLNAVTFNESFVNGSTLWGGIATRQFGISADALGNTGPMYNWGLQDTLTPGVRGIVRVLYEIGMLDVAAKVLNFAASDAFNRMYEEALIPMWFHMPFYWALVPQSMYEQAKHALFPNHSDYAAHAKLFEKTDYYHNKILANSAEIISDAAKEIKVGINCGYGFPLSPYAATAYASSDELVDTALASFGATCAPPNRPFGMFYKQAKAVEGGKPGYSYVSLDRMIDASTCVLPEYTWFIKDMPHYPELLVDGWVEWFANAPKGEDTVHDNARFPQWKHFISYFVFENLDTTDSLWSRIMDTLLAAVMWIMEIWRKLLLLPLFWM